MCRWVMNCRRLAGLNSQGEKSVVWRKERLWRVRAGDVPRVNRAASAKLGRAFLES
jgi:hypothetical protein